MTWPTLCLRKQATTLWSAEWRIIIRIRTRSRMRSMRTEQSTRDVHETFSAETETRLRPRRYKLPRRCRDVWCKAALKIPFSSLQIVSGRVLNQSVHSYRRTLITSSNGLMICKCHLMLRSVKLCTLVHQICNKILICATANLAWLLKRKILELDKPGFKSFTAMSAGIFKS